MKRPITAMVGAVMALFLVFLYRNGSLQALFAKVFPVKASPTPGGAASMAAPYDASTTLGAATDAQPI